MSFHGYRNKTASNVHACLFHANKSDITTVTKEGSSLRSQLFRLKPVGTLIFERKYHL